MNDQEAVALAISTARKLSADVNATCSKVPHGAPFVDESELLLEQVAKLTYALDHLSDAVELLAKAQEH